MNVQAKDIAKIMGGKRVLGREVRDFADLDAIVEAGLPADAVERLRKALGASATDAPLLPATSLKGALKRALAESSPGKSQSRIIERAARLYFASALAFGNSGVARQFMFEPHDRLGGRRPIDCVETELAFKQVEQVLDSIVFGLPA